MTSRVKLIVAVVTALVVSACSKQQAGFTPPPPELGVVVVHPQEVPLIREASGRLTPVRAADVRARVAGVVEKRLYKEGSMVKEGQPLIRIDPAPLRAVLSAASADLQQADAAAKNASVTANRNRELSKQSLVSRMQLDDSEALERSTAAQVAAARARVETARINLGYANITAPISGRASRMRVLEGTLVGQGDATLLTTIEQLDPLYVLFDQPGSDFERFQRAAAAGSVSIAEGQTAEIHLVHPDGTEYEEKGTLDFSDSTVNPVTGAVGFRGLVHNPHGLLLPGMYVNVRLMAGTLKNGYRVPQLAVQRDGQGPYVLILGPDGKVALSRVETVSVVGNDWVLSSGLKDGDQVIVSGLQKAQPGSPAKAVPAGSAPDGGAAPAAAPMAPAAQG
jgi:membrane fusion protein (multidrug efflux system)